MSDDNIKVTIEGDEPSTPRNTSASTREAAPKAYPETDRAYAHRNATLNELRDAKIQENASRQQLLLTKANAAQEAAKRAWDNGEIDQMHALQREAAVFDAERIQIQAEGRRLEAMPYLPEGDPVEAFIAGRDSATQAWLREHPDDARILATGSDPRRVAKLNAADADAIAEGHKPGSKSYFSHVERFLGLRDDDGQGHRRQRGDGEQAEATVKVLKRGESPVPGTRLVKMSKREYALATDGSLTWERGPKRGQPLGVAEYLRRRGITDSAPEWQRLD